MGKTIGNVVISYDVNKNHTEVKNAMKIKGYFDRWLNGSVESPTYNLPNTTIWHQSKSTDQAISDLKIVCLALNVTLEKAVAVIATEFVGI